MADSSLRDEATDIADRLSDHPAVAVDEIEARLQELLGMGVPLAAARDTVIREYTSEYDEITFDRSTTDHDLRTVAESIHGQVTDTSEITVEMVHEQLQKRVVKEGVDVTEAKESLLEETNRLLERRRKQRNRDD
jgi:hypothetical protein